jgi:hypothetical protein
MIFRNKNMLQDSHLVSSYNRQNSRTTQGKEITSPFCKKTFTRAPLSLFSSLGRNWPAGLFSLGIISIFQRKMS